MLHSEQAALLSPWELGKGQKTELEVFTALNKPRGESTPLPESPRLGGWRAEGYLSEHQEQSDQRVWLGDRFGPCCLLMISAAEKSGRKGDISEGKGIWDRVLAE